MRVWCEDGRECEDEGLMECDEVRQRCAVQSFMLFEIRKAGAT